MKTIATILALFLTQLASAQFINPGLDQWDEPDPMKPFEHIVGWETLNRISYASPNISVTREEEGQRVFARVQSNHAGIDNQNPGYLVQKIATKNLKSIRYTSRCDSLSGLGLCVVGVSDLKGVNLFSDTVGVSDSFDVRVIDFDANILANIDSIYVGFTANGTTFYGEPENDGYAVFDVDEVRVDFISSVDQQILDATFLNVYPNPSQGIFKLDLDTNLQADYVQVYSFNGQIIWSGQYSEEIDLGHLANGNYIISVYTDQGVVSERVSVSK